MEEESKIIQIIPINGMYAIFKDDNNHEFKRKVHLIALDESGFVFPLTLSDVFFEDPSTITNFVRFDYED